MNIFSLRNVGLYFGDVITVSMAMPLKVINFFMLLCGNSGEKQKRVHSSMSIQRTKQIVYVLMLLSFSN